MQMEGAIQDLHPTYLVLESALLGPGCLPGRWGSFYGWVRLRRHRVIVERCQCVTDCCSMATLCLCVFATVDMGYLSLSCSFDSFQHLSIPLRTHPSLVLWPCGLNGVLKSSFPQALEIGT